MPNPTRLMYSKVNQAFVFTFGDQLLRMGDNPMFFRRKAEAIRAALRQGLLVNEKTGYVTSVEGRRQTEGLGRAPRGLGALEGRATLRTPVGTRVRFVPNPASFQMYSRPPENGEEGTVTTVAHVGGHRSFMMGPGGGLLYVKWDRTGHQGVSPRDIEVIHGRSRRGVGGLEGTSKNEKIRNLDPFTRGYIEAALWSSNDESDESGGEPLDQNYGIEDITVESLDKMVRDCERFQQQYAGLLSQAGSPEQNGHDFWLTRNRHGAGFWDRGYSENIGKALTDAAHQYGEVYLTVNRGKISQD
jgi:hypothetical protein